MMKKSFEVSKKIKELKEALANSKTEINIEALGYYYPITPSEGQKQYMAILNAVQNKNNITNVDIRTGLVLAKYLAQTMNDILGGKIESSLENPSFRNKDFIEYFEYKKFFVSNWFDSFKESNFLINEYAKSKIGRLLATGNIIEDNTEEKFIEKNGGVKRRKVTISLPEKIIRLSRNKNHKISESSNTYQEMKERDETGVHNKLGVDNKVNIPVLESIITIELFQDLLLQINNRFKELRATDKEHADWGAKQKQLKNEAILVESIFRKNLKLLDAFLNLAVNGKDLDGALWGAATSSLRDGFVPFIRNIKAFYYKEDKSILDTMLQGMEKVKRDAEYFYLTSIIGLSENIKYDPPTIEQLNKKTSCGAFLELLRSELVNSELKNYTTYQEEKGNSLQEQRNSLFNELQRIYPFQSVIFDKNFQAKNDKKNVLDILENVESFYTPLSEKIVIEVDISNIYKELKIQSDTPIYKTMFGIAVCNALNSLYPVESTIKETNKLYNAFSEKGYTEFLNLFQKYCEPEKNNIILIVMDKNENLKSSVSHMLNTVGSLLVSEFKGRVIDKIKIYEITEKMNRKERLQPENNGVLDSLGWIMERFNEKNVDKDSMRDIKEKIRENYLNHILDKEKTGNVMIRKKI